MGSIGIYRNGEQASRQSSKKKKKKGPSGTALLKTAHPLDPCTLKHKGSLYLPVSQ